VGRIFYSPDWYEQKEGARFEDWEAYRAPSLNILRVCKRIHEEAEDVYLGGNMFVLPHAFNCRPPFSHSLNSQFSTLPNATRRLFSVVGFEAIKNVSLSFCSRGIIPLTMAHSDWKNDDFEHKTAAERLDHAHSEAKRWYRGFCDDRLSIIFDLYSNLRELELDFTNAFCPFGCCRDFDISFEHLGRLKLQVVRLLGLRDGEAQILEERFRVELSPKGEKLEDLVELQYGLGHDTWAKWRSANSLNAQEVCTVPW
jgi:hypothetical protein